MTAIGVIPARYGSTRFPGKALALLMGKPMIEWVCERVAAATRLNEVLVATDDERIRERVAGFGRKAVLTSPAHPSGTDRINEAITDSDADIVVNIQGDEPLLAPEDIDLVVAELESHPEADMATLAVPLRDAGSYRDPGTVKVVTDETGRALLFSRAPIPHARDLDAAEVPEGALAHVGLYAYRRSFLQQFCEWGPSRLELTEHLEQLRALERGAHIHVALTSNHPLGVDTPEDAAHAEALLKRELAAVRTTDHSPE